MRINNFRKIKTTGDRSERHFESLHVRREIQIEYNWKSGNFQSFVKLTLAKFALEFLV